MIASLAQFFGIFGVDLQAPTTFSAFVPWLLQVILGIAIVAFILRFFASVARSVYGQRWL